MARLSRFILIGGFLGAGKSTALLRLSRYLTERGLTVGLITNDQSTGLVDTAMLSSQGFAVQEIAGGCFCCRFPSLIQAADNLCAGGTPDVLIAEPVGSCTDLVASVAYPLRQLGAERYEIAPFSVLVDPIRARRVFGLEAGGSFSDKVCYVYRKQLEEADCIVINKSDLLDDPELDRLRDCLAREYPRSRVLNCSARIGTGLEPWFELLLTERQSAGRSMPLDYDEYAEGEARLGWLNATAGLRSQRPRDAREFLAGLAERIAERLARIGAEIAHLKMTLSPRDGYGMAVINLVRGDHVPECSLSLAEPVRDGQLLINLRAEADPAELRRVVEDVLAGGEADYTATIERLDSFRPARPQPTYRLAHADAPLI